MGLEVSGFSKLDLLEAREVSDFARRPLPEEKPTTRETVEFPISGKTAGELAAGQYAFEESFHFVVGDYPRLELLQGMLADLNDSTDGRRDFEELYSAGRQDVFSSEVCAKLVRDFEKHHSHFAEGRFTELCANLLDAFRFGADKGCVVFH